MIWPDLSLLEINVNQRCHLISFWLEGAPHFYLAINRGGGHPLGLGLLGGASPGRSAGRSKRLAAKPLQQQRRTLQAINLVPLPSASIPQLIGRRCWPESLLKHT